MTSNKSLTVIRTTQCNGSVCPIPDNDDIAECYLEEFTGTRYTIPRYNPIPKPEPVEWVASKGIKFLEC